MEAEKKALFFDIDGTILSEINGQVPKSAAAAMDAASRQGHLLFINSGRTLACIPRALFDMSFTGFLCGCGTDIVYQGSHLFYRPVSPEEAGQTIALVRKYNMGAVLEGRDCIYFPDRSPRFPQMLDILERFTGVYEIQVGWEQPFPVFSKLIAFGDEDSQTEAFCQEAARLYDVIGRGGQFYELVPKGFSKATAIREVLKQFAVKEENAYVFGDSSNDLSMFQAVPNAVAMGRHDGVLEPYASYITDTVEQDGLYKAMVHLGLIAPLQEWEQAICQ